MKLTQSEVMVLQDIVGNASLALKHIHKCISEDTDVLVLIDAMNIGQKISTTIEDVLHSHNPLSFRRKKE